MYKEDELPVKIRIMGFVDNCTHHTTIWLRIECVLLETKAYMLWDARRHQDQVRSRP